MRNPTDKNVNPNGEILATTKTMPAMAGAQSAVRLQPPMKLASVSKAILKPGIVTDGDLLEDVIVSPEAAQADMMPATDGLAPLQAAGEGDVLLAQATGTPLPPAAGAGGFAWTPGTVGAVAGGVVVIGAAGGGSAATPVVPLAVSAPQRTASVYEDSDDMEEPTDVADGDYSGFASGDLTVGGDTTTFQKPTSLEGRYGDFTFNTTTGEWTYTLDNEDPDTQALNGYRGGKLLPSEFGPGASFPGHDYLEVTTTSGFTTVIDVEIFGNTDGRVLDPVTVTENEWVLIDLSGAYSGDEYLDYVFTNYGYDSNFYQGGGFFIYQADIGQAAAMEGDSDFIYFDVVVDEMEDGDSVTVGWGEVEVNVNPFDGDIDGDAVALTWGFGDGSPDIHESQWFSFNGLSVEDGFGDGSTQMILVLDAYGWDDAEFDLDFAAAGVLGVQVYGDGTDDIAIVGTENAINSFLAGDGLQLLVNDGYWDEESGFNIDIYATNGDGLSSRTGSDFYANNYYTDYNDAPFLDVESDWGDGFFVLDDAFGVNDLSFFVPAGDDINSANSVVLGDFVDVNLWDEEDIENGDGDWGYFGAYLDGDGTLSLLEDDGLISGDYVQIWAANDGDWDYWYASDLSPEDLDAALTNFSSITFYGNYGDLENLAEGLHFNADEFFDVGETAELELYMMDSDEKQTTTSIFLVGAEANEAPVMTVNLSKVDFEDMEVADDEEPETNVSGFVATAFEDQSINFKGFSVSDADVGDGDLLLQFMAEIDWRYDQPLFYVDAAYADLVWMPDMTEYDGYFPWTEALFLSGSAEELNAALAAGAVHFVGAPDYNGEAYVWAQVTDFGQNGYVDFDDGDFSDMSSGAAIMLTIEAVEDKPIALKEVVMDSQYDMEDGGYWLANKTLLSADEDDWYIYDAEYLNEEEGATLDVTGVTKLTGSGTLTGNAADGWTYTPGAGELDGEIGSEFATFSYTVSDGHSSVTNMISLLVPEIMAP